MSEQYIVVALPLSHSDSKFKFVSIQVNNLTDDDVLKRIGDEILYKVGFFRIWNLQLNYSHCEWHRFDLSGGKATRFCGEALDGSAAVAAAAPERLFEAKSTRNNDNTNTTGPSRPILSRIPMRDSPLDVSNGDARFCALCVRYHPSHADLVTNLLIQFIFLPLVTLLQFQLMRYLNGPEAAANSSAINILVFAIGVMAVSFARWFSVWLRTNRS